LASDGPDVIVVESVPNHILDEFGVSTVASGLVVEPDRVIENSPEAGVVTCADELTVVGGAD
jgi:hypothetical protein